MKVLHIASTLEGGAGIGLIRYHRALLSAGVSSRILTGGASTLPEDEHAAITWRKAPVWRRLTYRLGLARPLQEQLRNQIHRLDKASASADYELFSLPFSDYHPEDHPWILEADVINIHWVAGFVDWPRFFKRTTKPVIFTLHDQHHYLGGFHYERDVVNNPHLAELETGITALKKKALLGHRVGVIANSRWNADQTRASRFFPAATAIEVIYYPLDSDVFHPRPSTEAKAAFGIAGDRRVLGFACDNLNNKRKGFDLLLSTLEQLPVSLRANVTLLSFGKDPSAELRSKVDLPWVHLGFLSSDEDKARAYAAMDVFVAPSRAEAFGLTALEAESVGIPVVASKIGGLQEAVPTAVSPAPEIFLDEITALLRNHALCAERSIQGRALVLSRHDPALIGLQLKAFYRTFLS